MLNVKVIGVRRTSSTVPLIVSLPLVTVALLSSLTGTVPKSLLMVAETPLTVMESGFLVVPPIVQALSTLLVICP